MREAIEKLKKDKVDFDFDGEVRDVALNPIYQEIYPFSKIVGKAMFNHAMLHSAAISTKLMKVFGGGKLDLLIGLGRIEVAPLRAALQKWKPSSIAAYSRCIDYSINFSSANL